MDPCIIAYMFLTYAIKAIIFVWVFTWLQTKLTNNFIVIVLVLTVFLAALDMIVVSVLPASGWKKALRERIRVPANMQCVLALDYLLKAIILYYLIAPVNGVSYYLSSTMLMQFIIVFVVMLCVDLIIAWGLENTVSKVYAEQFCASCSM